ncbi:prepilin-type N-terminal cleavage/methylation domain-containing protein [Desulfosoma caldarium]|uniref:Prepilin-type N-terminal cleavage/methylation domain-containing protein n=1 Tax=Desulfosoma caldarium TaxID=610254 RepID=A0A3N1UPJ0_9BACT|nr:prepilin-type N-terminal cleavage/methylation domain-containing protein [Desulfosoma caldarium]ROQ90660.1 prepilin-type N-terminal cleavage/methylation domain-containing protein [Desulfosoma caldarium]
MKGKGSDQRGFTIVELAIVLVIIGIILGAVLKGRELITNAKAHTLYNQYREIVGAIYTYYDRYGWYPGDDPKAGDRWSSTHSGNGDGLIVEQGEETCPAGYTGEGCLAWEHMRLAGILGGPKTYDPYEDLRAPEHVYGSYIIITYEFGKHIICFHDVPGRVAQMLEEHYDDGKYNKGNIWSIQNYYEHPNWRVPLCFDM